MGKDKGGWGGTFQGDPILAPRSVRCKPTYPRKTMAQRLCVRTTEYLSEVSALQFPVNLTSESGKQQNQEQL